MSTEQRESLDPKIAPYVVALNEEGITTFESCQGGEGHCAPEPFIHFKGDQSEGQRALAFAMFKRWPISELQRVWSVIDGEPTGPVWRLTLVGPRL